MSEQALSDAIMKQWHRAKARRDPNSIMRDAQAKGLTAIQSETSGLTAYTIIGNNKCVFKGSADAAALFIENYSVLVAM